MPGENRGPNVGEILRNLAVEKALTDISGPAQENLSPEEIRQMLHELRVHQIELEMQKEELRRAQVELEASRALYFDLYNLAPVGYFTVSEKGLILEVNLPGAGLFGLPRNKLLKQPLSRFIFPEDQDGYYNHGRKLFETGEPQAYELRMVRRDGTQFWARLMATVARDGEGEAPTCRTIISDITERKRAEETVCLNESRLQILLNMSQYEVKNIQELLDHALDGAIRLTGSKVGYIYHYYEEQQEFILNTWSKEVMQACTVADPQAIYQLEKTGIWGEVIRQRKPIIVNDFQAPDPLKKGYPEGHVALYNFMSLPVFCGNQIVAVVGVGNKESDYTQTDVLQLSLLMDSVWKFVTRKRAEEEQKKLEDHLRQAHKMENIGTLAGGIAHDFNNILGVIVGYTEMALQDVITGNVNPNDLKEIYQATMRAKELVKQILTFSRRSDQEKKPLRVSSIVTETLKLMRASIPSIIKISQTITAEEETVLADPTQLQQVLINLCTNAAHAMRDEGGMIRVDLDKVRLDSHFTLKSFEISPGDYVKLSVTDTGHGMTPEIAARIFEPYFTTKEKGQGTGLGLATVHGIVRDHNGAISVYSEPGRGTTFKVYFPIIVSQALSEKDIEDRLPTGQERILLVDDELALVDICKRMLERLGYGVTTRTGSIEALEVFRANRMSSTWS
ncbi:MAG: GAF domain-containing protein [Deltaproteobacteria bacterium]|nr:GAF domain-containing protein [Deltaproteobacteria bacterium]